MKLYEEIKNEFIQNRINEGKTLKDAEFIWNETNKIDATEAVNRLNKLLPSLEEEN